jgi:regulator of protease activity HflC (stomatin/prohibitin superfamily)
MFLIIFGLILFLVGFFLKPETKLMDQIRKPLLGVGFILFLAGLMSKLFVQIEAGTVGVQVLFGKTQENVLDAGLHMVNPLVEIKTFDVKTQNYTMSAVHTEGDQEGDDAIRVLSADGLEVSIDVTVLFKVTPSEAPFIYNTIGTDYKGVIIRPLSRTKMRDFAVYYDAVSLYSSKRDEFQSRVVKALETDLKKRGLILEQVLVRNIMLPESVRKTIESKINAEQEAQKMQFVLQKEKQEAERKRVEAQGIADYQRIISSGLGDKQLQYEQIQAMKGLMTSPNAKVIIMGGSGKTPIILDGKGN